MTHALPLLSDQGSSGNQNSPGGDPARAGFGTLSTARGNLPLRAMDVQARIDGLEARVSVRQTFANNLGEPLEATYVFPLPDRAAVSSFRMEVNGRVIDGVLKERGEARRDYEKAIQAGHRASIAEEDRAGVFTIRVGNLLAGEEAAVSLTLISPLPYQDGEATFQFPLVVAPRYVPGVPLEGPPVGPGVAPDTDAAPDASRISPPVLLPGFPNPVRLSLAVEVPPSDLDLTDFRSSLHSVLTETALEGGGGGVRRITLQPGERLNRDFILRFRVGGESVNTSLLLKSDDDGDGARGTFLLTLLPPSSGATSPRPMDVAFVLDRSGSMSGWKIVASRRALGRMIDGLTAKDRFSLIAFDDRFEEVSGSSGLAAATDRNRFRAVERLASLEARGGTEMALPLKRAVELLSGSGAERERILVLITDGQVGNEDQIIREIGGALADIRVFTLGIDQAVNAGFLRRLGALGGGSCELVESEDRLDEVLDRIHRSIGAPVLTDLEIRPRGMEIDSVVPSRLPDLPSGAPVFIRGRYRGASGSISIQAKDGASRPWSTAVAGAPTGNEAVTRLWARASVRDLEDRYAITGGEELSKQIVETSLRFGVLSRFTAFVAVDRSEVANPEGKVQGIVQPVEMPEGWEMGGIAFQNARLLAPQSFCAYSALPESPDELADAMSAMKAILPKRSARRRLSPQPSLFNTAGPLDLSAYRRRAAELLCDLEEQAKSGSGIGGADLGIHYRKLRDLVHDLLSIGAPEAEVGPLAEVLKMLEAFILAGSPAGEEKEPSRIWSLAAERLRLFANGPGGEPPARGGKRGRRSAPREGFWK